MDVGEIDLNSQSFKRNPFPTFAGMRELGPVVQTKMPMLTSGFLMLIKCLGVTLFLFPWVAIRWFLHGAAKNTKLSGS